MPKRPRTSVHTWIREGGLVGPPHRAIGAVPVIARDSPHIAAPPRQERNPALDSLRALAALAVVVLHATPLPPDSIPGILARRVAGYGWMGVDLFFVLSGYLITGILYDRRRDQNYYHAFYARRARRILPVAYGTIAAIIWVLPVLMHSAAPEARAVGEVQFWYWGFVANYWLAAHGGTVAAPLTAHFWSLAVEEQFYLLWPLVVRNVSGRALSRISVGLIVASLVLRVCARLFGLIPSPAWIFATPVRMDGLALGALLAVAQRDTSIDAAMHRAARWAVPLAAVTLGSIVLTQWTPDMGFAMQTVGYTALAILAGVSVYAVTRRPQSLTYRSLARLPWLSRVGGWSYGIYVYHFPLGWIFERLGAPSAVGAPTYLALVVASSVMLAAASWHFIEAPLVGQSSRHGGLVAFRRRGRT
jgi:peptidoglycan/LPS O-acetylase OafA/YrhL